MLASLAPINRRHRGPKRSRTIDVFHPEDLSGPARCGAVVDDSDHRVSEVGGVRVVGDGTRQQGDAEDVVEDLLAEPGPEARAEVDEEQDTVDGGHRPKPVGSVGGELLAPARGVGAEGVVAVD